MSRDEPRFITEAEFRAWLDRQPSDRVFCLTYRECPLAECLNDLVGGRGAEWVAVGVSIWWLMRTPNQRLPQWAHQFVMGVEARCLGTDRRCVTTETARAVMNRIAEENQI